MKLDKKLIGIRIMQRRKENDLTQEQLAEQIEISKNHLSSLERGVYLPTTSVLFRICNILGETPDYYLLGKVNVETDEATKLIKSLPESSQRIVLRLLETYLEELRKI